MVSRENASNWGAGGTIADGVATITGDGTWKELHVACGLKLSEYLGKTVTVSFDERAVSSGATFHSTVEVRPTASALDVNRKCAYVTKSVDAPTEEWERREISFEMKEGMFTADASKGQPDWSTDYFAIAVFNHSNIAYQVRRLKLEVGSIATPWDYASEDVTTLTNTVNTVKQTATANVAKISSLTTTLGTNSDGTSKAGDVMHRVSTAETAIEQTVNNVLIKATQSDTTAAQGGQHLIQSLINVAPSGVTINADKVNIEGAAIFTGSGRLSQDSLNNAYDASGAASGAVNALKTDLASSTGTTVIDGGHIATDSLTVGHVSGLQNTLNGKASNADVERASNLLLDTDVPSLTKVNAAHIRYWSDTSQSSYITTSIVAISDPPEDGIRYAAQFVGNGTNAAVAQRALAFYGDEGNFIPLIEGQVYTASWWARVTSGAGATRFMSPVGNNNNEQSGLTFLTTEWQRVTWAFIPKPNADYTRVWFYGRFAARETGTIQLCGFKLQMGDHSGTSGNPNLTPWFSKTVDDKDYWLSLHVRNGSVSNSEGLHAIYDGEDGWAHITLDSRTSAGNDGSKNCYMNMHVRKDKILPSIKPDTSYTWLIEVRNMDFQGTGKLYVRPSVGDAKLDIFAALNSQVGLFDSDGVAHANVRSKASFSALTQQDTRGYCYIPTGCYADFELRVSLYEGSYVGGYKPYSPTVGAVDDAAKTAKNYISIDPVDGIKVHDSGDVTTFVQIASGVIDFVRSGVSAMKMWVDNSVAKVRVGLESAGHSVFSPEGMEVFAYDETAGEPVSTAKFGAGGSRVGAESSSNIVMTDQSVAAYSDTGQEYFSVDMSEGVKSTKAKKGVNNSYSCSILASGASKSFLESVEIPEGELEAGDEITLVYPQQFYLYLKWKGTSSSPVSRVRVTEDTATGLVLSHYSLASLGDYKKSIRANIATTSKSTLTYGTGGTITKRIKLAYATDGTLRGNILVTVSWQLAGNILTRTIQVTNNLNYAVNGDRTNYGPYEIDISTTGGWASYIATIHGPTFQFGTAGGENPMGAFSVAMGEGTSAASENQTALGLYNAEDTGGTYAVIIGNGTDDDNRSNALAVRRDGTCDVGNVQSVAGDNHAYPLFIWTSSMANPESYGGTYPVSHCFVYYVPNNGLYYCEN
jgi:hypothetical protein